MQAIWTCVGITAFLIMTIAYIHQLARIRQLDARVEAAKRYCRFACSFLHRTMPASSSITDDVPSARHVAAVLAGMHDCIGHGGSHGEVFRADTLEQAPGSTPAFSDDGTRLGTEARPGVKAQPGHRLRTHVVDRLRAVETTMLPHTQWQQMQRTEQVVCAARLRDTNIVVAIAIDVA